MSGSVFFHADITTLKGRIFDATKTETILHAQIQLNVGPGLFNSWLRASFVHELYASKFAMHGVSLDWINTGEGEKKFRMGKLVTLIEPCPIAPAFREALAGCREKCARVCKYSGVLVSVPFPVCDKCEVMEAWFTTCKECKRNCEGAVW